MDAKERTGYILMELITPPKQQNKMVRNGEIIDSQVVSELGIFGIVVTDGQGIQHNQSGGHLMRTKSAHSNEGGVASGYAVLDTPMIE